MKAEETYIEGLIDLAKIMKTKPDKRNIFLIVSVLVLIISVLGYYSRIEFFKNPITMLGLFGIGFISISIVLASLLSFVIKDAEKSEEQLKVIDAERTMLLNKTEERKNIIDFIRLNLNQLDEYYLINKIQARNSFRLSVFTILVGLVAIIIPVLFMIMNSQLSLLGVISSVSGAILEFAGATSLVLYKESSKNIASFYGKLTSLQNFMLAIELAESLGKEERDKEISKIISSLIMSE